jgi:hypothetical protein
VSSVDYLIRTHGRDALVGLIKSYARGLTDDEALGAAIGLDANAFDEAWRSDLDAKKPVAYGPKSAPAGPIPEGWSTTGQPAGSGDGGPGSSGSPGAPSAARPERSPALPIALLAALVVGVILVAVVIRRRARPSP